MKKRNLFKFLFAGMIAVFLTVSCTKDLDVTLDDPTLFTSNDFFKDEASYKQFLAKLYAGLAVSGQTGPAGNSDISGIDEGFGQYWRAFWVMNELPTDEAIIAWADGNLPSLNTQTWSSNNEFIYAMFSRATYQTSLCNEFLRQTTDAKLNERNVSANTRAEIATYRAEARFLRAFSFYHLMDMFGSAPFTTENDVVGFNLPPQKDRAFLFSFITSELNAIDGSLKASGSNEYGRIDKVAAKMLLAKVYLNAQVYIGQDRKADASAALASVLSSSYTIPTTSYANSFKADNDVNGAQSEVIFPIRYSGTNTQTYGGTTFLAHASVGGSMSPAFSGVNGGWFGLRTRQEFYNIFGGDARGLFYTSGQNLSINNIGTFNDGYAINKWRNVKSTGQQGSDATGNFVDIDFPIFRLSDAYLMYAELAVGGQGSMTTAMGYVNALRTRAGVAPYAGAISYNFILDERAKELYWEGHRRQDLIRLGKFSGGSYLWQWKGGVQAGTSTDAKFNLFPIPSAAIGANPTLVQNPGY